MKGCLATLIVIAILSMLILVGGTCFLGNEVRQFVGRMEQGFEQARAVDAEFPFARTENGALEGSRLDAFLAIRRAVCEPTIESFDELTEWAKSEDFGLTDTWAWSTRVREIVEKIPIRLVAALRDQEMGYTEFRWVAETLHGTLAAADRAGGHQEATELVESFESYFRSDGTSVQAEVNGRDFDYAAIRHHLERKYRDFRPENLALILDRSAAIKDPLAQLMLDVLVLQVKKDDDPTPNRAAEVPDEE